MLSKRVALLVASLLLVGAWAGAAEAKDFYLGAGSGAQLQIGGGLPLPGQPVKATLAGPRLWGATITPTVMTMIKTTATSPFAGPGPSVFPPLLIGPAAVPKTITGTTGTAMKLVIPAGALNAAFGQRGLGQKTNNPNLFSVATNLVFKWPAVKATLSRRDMTTTAMNAMLTLPTMGPDTVYSFMGSPTSTARIVYRNPGKTKFFGGAAPVSIQAVTGSGALPSKAVTLWQKLVPGLPVPCRHPDIPGTLTPPNPACRAGLGFANPFGPQAAGGQAENRLTTQQEPPIDGPNIAVISAGALGTVNDFDRTATNPGLPTNMAQSIGFFWTTGQVQISMDADGTPELLLLSGSDARTPGGSGVVQLVSGSLSDREFTGPNSNRGWLRLVLTDTPPPATVPAVSNLGLAALTASLLAIGLLVAFRRRSATEVGA